MKKRLLLTVFLFISTVSIVSRSFLFSVAKNTKAPEFPSCRWINSGEGLSMEKLKGHVILLNFWTYSCINCIHVLPDLEYLENKYRDKPFYVIGVHSAKYANELEVENVQSAVSRYEITHPVVVDEKHRIWRTYGARAWPTYVLIGSDGHVMAKLWGEGRRKILDRLIKDAFQQGKQNQTLASVKYQIDVPPVKESELSFPVKLAMDTVNHVLYISDSNHNQIIEAALENAAAAKVLHRIGSGKKALTDGGYNRAAFFKPQGIHFHRGFLYVADTGNHALRVVDLKNKKVKTLIKRGKKRGFGKPDSPRDLVYYNNNLYIAMAGSHQLWELNVKKKEMDLFAGNGYVGLMDGSALGSSLAQPSGITLDLKHKRLYIADSDVSALRYSSLETGAVTTLIGKGVFKFGFIDGPFPDAYLQHPLGVFYNPGDEKVYIADTFNNAVRAADIASGKIHTLIKRSDKNKTVCTVEGTDCGVLPLNEPNDVLVYKEHIYIADTNNHLIRVFDTAAKKLETLTLSDK